jgi:hypothetical protein
VPEAACTGCAKPCPETTHAPDAKSAAVRTVPRRYPDGKIHSMNMPTPFSNCRFDFSIDVSGPLATLSSWDVTASLTLLKCYP